MLCRRNFLKQCAGIAGGLAFAQNIGLADGTLFSKREVDVNSKGIEGGDKPNILYIMADDHAANAISCYGSWLKDYAKTPNIDKIAAEGMRFNNCFCNNSICTPSRASIITGQYSHVNGVRKLGGSLKAGHPSFVRQLTSAGYQTAVIGKWHIKSTPSGFDHYEVLGSVGRHGQGKYYNPTFDKNGVKTSYKGYVTDIITDLTLDWLKSRDKNKPFLMMCQHKSPHGLWQYAERHKDMFKNKQIVESSTLFDDFSNRAPQQLSRHWAKILKLAGRMQRSTWPTGPLDTTGMNNKQKIQAAYQKYVKDYIRCITANDENVGRLLDYLDSEGLKQNTIVVYTSDQGMFLGEHGFYDKRLILEDSLRMPFLVRYPKEIKAGSVCDKLVVNIDFAETFLDFAGVKVPVGMQGRSFRALLQGKTPTDWRKSFFYAYWAGPPRHHGIRTDRYKLICYHYKNKADVYDMFDLEKDPLELVSVYDNPAYSSVVSEMHAELTRVMNEIGISEGELPGND